MAAQVILVEAQPAQISTGGAVTVRLAGGGGTKPYDYSGQNDWRAGIRGLPTMIASLEYDGGEFPAGSVPSAAAIEWQGSSKAMLATLMGYLWTDAAITVRVGPEGALPPVVISGKVLDATAQGGKLSLALADPAAALKKPLLTARFAGTGGLEGPAEWDGLIRKRVWGKVWNLAGEPIDKANNIYCFADPLRPIQAFDAVRDKGAAAAALTTLAWQGSAAATFTALQAASAPAGGGVLCPSIACIKWWTQPAGELCADLRGEIGAGYVETTAAIAQRLVEGIAGPAFAAGTVAAAAAARPAAVGWLADNDSTTVAAMLDELLGNSSLLWLLDDAGAVVLREWAWGASAASARSEDVDRKQVLRPLAIRRLGYKRNETQMARGDLAAIVLSSDVNYLDGTPIETLKPADPGATAGADIGVDLRLPTSIPTAAQLVTSLGTAAAIAGQGALATANNIVATQNAIGSFDNIIPDNDYRDPSWWGFASLPNVTFNAVDSFWEQRRAIIFTCDRDFDFYSQMFTVEPGCSYRIRFRIWNNNTGAGWTGAFWPLIHMPLTAWWSIKHGTGVDPSIANSANAIVANGDTGAQEFYFNVPNNNMREIQFRFRSTARGSGVIFQAAITKVPQVGKDLIRPGTATKYITSEIETVLGIASAITGQGPGATAANLAGFDPTAAAQLTTAYNGGLVTAGWGETLKRRIGAGASISLAAQVSVNAGGSSSGNIKARIEVSLFGVNSWSTVATGPGASVTPTEPGIDNISSTFTNSTGAEQVFEFRVVIVRTPGTAGGATITSQSYVVG